MSLIEKINTWKKEWQEKPLRSAADIRDFKKKYMHPEGVLSDFIQQLRLADQPEVKKKLGQAINRFKADAATHLANAQKTLSTSEKTRTKQSEDLTKPPQQIAGSLHPLTHMIKRISRVLLDAGFEAVTGPEIENDWYNFTALNFPKEHPARAMQDTFFLKRSKDALLRTHTSSVQIRHLEKNPGPARIFSVGKVYRKEAISARSSCFFHQAEALYVDEQVSFIDLKRMLVHLCKSLFGTQIDMRLRPSYFPFTEVSAEIDISCTLCARKGCDLCKKKGWLEIGGAGLVDPQVLENCGIDSKKYSGYAFGIGIDRSTMIYHTIKDIRLFGQNHVDFLNQFPLL